MKQCSSLRRRVVISIWILSIGMIYADGPGTTLIFSPPPMNQIGGGQSSAYDSANNQFMFTWLSGASRIDYVLFNASGAQIGSQQSLPGSASSSPFICYNSVNKQYLITWIAGSVYYGILSDTGSLVVASNVVSPGILNGDPTCCYNSTNNQYCITWTAQNGLTSSTYFAILNADGTVAKDATVIPGVAGETTANATDSFATYNSKDNQYLFTWLGVTGGPQTTVFAIYDAQGNEVVPAQIVPQFPDDPMLGTRGHPPFSCYNSINNQYMIAWSGQGSGAFRAFFAIYNAAGVAVVPATELVTPSGAYQTPVCSYNVRNNQYFASWNDSYTQALCAIIDADGTVASAEIELPLLPYGEPISPIFNSFSVQNDSYFITWYDSTNTNAYVNIFTLTPNLLPPTNVTGQRTLNRFANYGEFVTQLTWTPSLAPNIVSYNIYREGILIATLPGSAASFTIHNQPRVPTIYAVQAINNFGDKSAAMRIKL